MDVLTSETCWALNKVIIKQVASSWSLSLFNYQDDARSNKYKLPLSCTCWKNGSSNFYSQLSLRTIWTVFLFISINSCTKFQAPAFEWWGPTERQTWQERAYSFSRLTVVFAAQRRNGIRSAAYEHILQFVGKLITNRLVPELFF